MAMKEKLTKLLKPDTVPGWKELTIPKNASKYCILLLKKQARSRQVLQIYMCSFISIMFLSGSLG